MDAKRILAWCGSALVAASAATAAIPAAADEADANPAQPQAESTEGPRAAKPVANADVAGYEWGPAVDLLASLTGDYVSEWDEVELDDGSSVKVQASKAEGQPYTFDEEGWQRFLADADAVGLDVDEDSMRPMFDHNWEDYRSGRSKQVYGSVNVGQSWPLDEGDGVLSLTMSVMRAFITSDGSLPDEEVQAQAVERMASSTNYAKYMTSVDYVIKIGSDGRAKVECSTPTWQTQQWGNGRVVGVAKVVDMTIRDTEAVDTSGADALANASFGAKEDDMSGDGWSFEPTLYPDSYDGSSLSRSDGKAFEEPLAQDPGGTLSVGDEIVYRTYEGRSAHLADSVYDESRNGNAYRVRTGRIVGFYEDRALIADEDGRVRTIRRDYLPAMIAYTDVAETDPVGEYEVGDRFAALAEGREAELQVSGFIAAYLDADDDGSRVLLADADGKTYSVTYDNMSSISEMSDPSALSDASTLAPDAEAAQ